MTKKLGKGLEALIKDYDSTNQTHYLDGKIPMEYIQPNEAQPRQAFNDVEMHELMQSIKDKGVLQPITVRELSSTKFIIIAGERRYRASKALGLKWIPAFTVKINDESEMMEYALIENIQRVNLNAVEEAEGYAILRGKYNLSQKDIANKVSKSRSEITNKMRLLKLPPIIKNSLRDNTISYGHARSLLSIKESLKIMQVYYKIIQNNLSVRDTEKLAKLVTTDKKLEKNNYNNQEITSLEKKLKKYFNEDIYIKINKKNSGSINISFKSIMHLKKIIEKLNDE
tara:strand:+ start:584 stop:1435 length:852 start_codon:yes stop_codon:yes gene_type:complete